MTPDPKAIWQTVLATAYQEYTAAKNSDRSHRDGVVVTPVEIVDFQVRAPHRRYDGVAVAPHPSGCLAPPEANGPVVSRPGPSPRSVARKLYWGRLSGKRPQPRAVSRELLVDPRPALKGD